MACILLVEDDKTIRLTVEFVLTKADYEVTTAADGKIALDVASEVSPDLVLLDVMLPEVSGLEVARTLRARGDDVPIIMLTALSSEQDMVAGLDAGADDYITKPFSTAELLARIRAHLRRRRHKNDGTQRVIEAGELVIDLDAARVTRSGSPLELRGKEYKLLAALSSHTGMLCTRKWLSEVVWNEAFISTSRTIDTHIRRLRKAIDGNGWTYIKTEHGMGYRFEPEHIG